MSALNKRMATPLVVGWEAKVSGLVNFPELNGVTVRLVADQKGDIMPTFGKGTTKI